MPKLEIKKVYMEVAYQFAKCSYAERRQVGAVIVKDGQIISFGYNGTPNGFDNCCEVDDTTKREVLHAESNAISKVAQSTISSTGATLYVTTSPCFDCSKLIIQSGIKKVYWTEAYRDLSGIELLKKANIEVERIHPKDLNLNE
tara:strand:+ start:15048 stop:15479 length:432 start_codon:yes stop_codon:yes gene_type:complete